VDKIERRRREEIVIRDYGGILPQCEAFYLHSIVYAADRTMDAFMRFSAAVTAGKADILVVATIQESLAHAAALSRFFWPSKGKLRDARGAKLRAAFNVNEDSPLTERSLRNALEHFDERLDEFLLENDTGHFFPDPMVGDHKLADDPAARIFKLVDPGQQYFVILSEKHGFAPIIEEVDRVLGLASAWSLKAV
jgi:hypothetical protein